MTGGTGRGRRRPVLAALVVLAVPGTATACGTDPEVAGDDSPSVSPTAEPTWPPAGCATVTAAQHDHLADVGGAPSPEGAVRQVVADATEVRRAPAGAAGEQDTWWVLDPTGTVVAAVDLARGSSGWLVEQVERCAD